jgi:hypothetical protein
MSLDFLKSLMTTNIILFGTFALPFAALSAKTE